MKFSQLLSLLACTLSFLIGCKDTTTAPLTPSVNAAPALTDISTIISLTYKDMYSRAITLDSMVTLLKNTPTDAFLDEAKQAWRATRRPWEQSEGFLFGPVDSKGIDPKIDSWPLNKIDLDAVLAGSQTLTKETIDQLESTQKGFHTIEYLLFGATNSKTAANFTVRELEYLTATTQSFKAAVLVLSKSWDSAGEDYGANFTMAGVEGKSKYPSQQAALQEILNGMIAICDEVATGKINEPFTQQNRQLEESQFSDNSNADFADNIRSVRNVYLGVYGSFNGKGISSIVATKNPELDARTKREIDAAVDAIAAMLPSFGQAITNNKSSVTAAQTAVLKLKQTLNADILPLLLVN